MSTFPDDLDCLTQRYNALKVENRRLRAWVDEIIAERDRHLRILYVNGETPAEEIPYPRVGTGSLPREVEW